MKLSKVLIMIDSILRVDTSNQLSHRSGRKKIANRAKFLGIAMFILLAARAGPGATQENELDILKNNEKLGDLIELPYEDPPAGGKPVVNSKGFLIGWLIIDQSGHTWLLPRVPIGYMTSPPQQVTVYKGGITQGVFLIGKLADPKQIEDYFSGTDDDDSELDFYQRWLSEVQEQILERENILDNPYEGQATKETAERHLANLYAQRNYVQDRINGEEELLSRTEDRESQEQGKKTDEEQTDLSGTFFDGSGGKMRDSLHTDDAFEPFDDDFDFVETSVDALQGPVVQFLTPGLRPLTNVNQYQPFVLQVTLPLDGGTTADTIEVTLSTPHGWHTMDLENPVVSGSTVTYRSPVQFWTKETGIANPFEDFFSLVGVLKEDPEPLYKNLYADNGDPLTLEFGSSSAQIKVYDTYVQQGSANTQAAFNTAKDFYTWLGNQLQGLEGGAYIDLKGLQALKAAFPADMVPWELMVLGDGGNISAAQVAQLQQSAQKKLDMLPQVHTSLAAFEGADLKHYFVSHGFLKTFLNDPSTWNVTTPFIVSGDLPNAFSKAAAIAVADATREGADKAGTAFKDTLLRGYVVFAGVSGGNALWTLSTTYVATAGQIGGAVIHGEGEVKFVRGTTSTGETASNWDLFVSTLEVYSGPVIIGWIGHTIGQGKTQVTLSKAKGSGLSASQSQEFDAFGMLGGRIERGLSGAGKSGDGSPSSRDIPTPSQPMQGRGRLDPEGSSAGLPRPIPQEQGLQPVGVRIRPNDTDPSSAGVSRSGPHEQQLQQQLQKQPQTPHQGGVTVLTKDQISQLPQDIQTRIDEGLALLPQVVGRALQEPRIQQTLKLKNEKKTFATTDGIEIVPNGSTTGGEPYNKNVPDNLERNNTQAVIDHAEDLGPYGYKQPDPIEKNTRTKAGHAEKKAYIHDVEQGDEKGLVVISRETCTDCKDFFKAEAQSSGKSIVAVDPTRIRVFQPDGRTIEIPHSMQAGSRNVGPHIR